ncbi:Na/Pi cotransporter family protein [Methanocella arvoryzae]|uniref:Na(+)/phosphate symporter n=1 Tax=Methanocella arvoryzae (strain DSM 22066 / NBRC 105507 / MRE50) TaxID=351160 RepID=Q0W3W9_METAR|nr:Na/Pi cotransporter family protein [Methanocella arvoryzae]CAJ36924.1 putative Na(+)/phosphate symporter [Methanocella arvoryzae MRE50]
MGYLELFAIIPGLILFLYGIEHFSGEILKVAGERFRSLLGKLTSTPLRGALLGAGVTAIVQSSTATTVIVIGLVNAGTISFEQSLGVIIGANVGATITAQLVAFKLTVFAPVFILIGFLLSIAGRNYKFLGRPIFYFGLVFYSLTLISSAVEPLKSDPGLLALLSSFNDPVIALAAGILFTVLLQSSSVTIGLAVILAGSGLISLDQAIPLMLGANIGTTATGLIVSYGMSLHSKRAAVAHLLCSLLGVAIFIPFLGQFTALVLATSGDAGMQVANAHLIFNVIRAAIFLAAIRPFKALVEWLVPGNEPEILFRTEHLPDRVPDDTVEAFDLIVKELKHSTDLIITLFDESMRTLETPKSGDIQKIEKLESLSDYLDERIERAILEISQRDMGAKEAGQTVLLVRISSAIENLGDAGEDVGSLAKSIDEKGLTLSPESREELMTVYRTLRANLEIIRDSLPAITPAAAEQMKQNDAAMREQINASYRKHMHRLYTQKAYAGTMIVEVLSVLEASNLRAREIRKLIEANGTRLNSAGNGNILPATAVIMPERVNRQQDN